MVWTDTVQGAALAQGGSLSTRRNAAMCRPDHLPFGFEPESTLPALHSLQICIAI